MLRKGLILLLIAATANAMDFRCCCSSKKENKTESIQCIEARIEEDRARIEEAEARIEGRPIRLSSTACFKRKDLLLKIFTYLSITGFSKLKNLNTETSRDFDEYFHRYLRSSRVQTPIDFSFSQFASEGSAQEDSMPVFYAPNANIGDDLPEKTMIETMIETAIPVLPVFSNLHFVNRRQKRIPFLYQRTKYALYLSVEGHPDTCEIHFQDKFLTIEIHAPTMAFTMLGFFSNITFEIPYSLKILSEFKFDDKIMKFDEKKFDEDLRQTFTYFNDSFLNGVDNDIVLKLSYSNVDELYRARDFGPERNNYLDKYLDKFFLTIQGPSACRRVSTVAIFEFLFVKTAPGTYRMSEDFIFKFGPGSQSVDLLGRQIFRNISEIPNLEYDETKLFSLGLFAHVFTKIRLDAAEPKQKKEFAGFMWKK